MKNKKNILTLFLIVFIAFAANAQTSTKPRPPRSLRYISENLRILEESHDEGEFDEAIESIETMTESLEEISKEINAAGSGALLSELLSDLSDYEDVLRQKRPDDEEYEEARIEISMALFKIMDAFTYRTPPLLDFIDRQLDELKEEVLEESEWDGAAEELDEIQEFWLEILDNYSSIDGVKKLGEDIDDAMEDLEDAVRRENAGKVVDSVQRIQSLIGEIADLITG